MSKRISGEPFVEVLRGNQVESVHDVAAHAVDAQGRILSSFGNVDTPVYLRSSAKPFIAATALVAGVQQLFNLHQREVAVMAASHSGEAFHVDAVRSILQKIGLDESALQCGAAWPYDAPAQRMLMEQGIAPAPIYNNCSGKHAGILALCKAIGADPASYTEIANTAQQRILRFCAQMSSERLEDMPLGVDGCGIPVYATSLRNAALSYIRFATLTGIDEQAALALGNVRAAMIAFPEYMSGTEEFDAALIRAYGGKLVCKGGAEGVHALAILNPAIAVVLKVIDGNERARAPAVLRALQMIGAISSLQLLELDNFAYPPVTNRAGRIVGRIRACRERVGDERASL
ncbi:MAG: asparaginase [Candidatus Eremiobacteraeota bacterium]|nr:asparaginase [Candidatus Eremiobacteraeota bacterium]